MRNIVTSYFATGLVFLALDAVWLTLAANAIYRPLLGPILRDGFDLGAAAAFYFIYVAGMVFFAVRPGLLAESPFTALVHGAALGFVAYATTVTLVDLAWGSFVTAAASGIGCFLTLRIGRMLDG